MALWTVALGERCSYLAFLHTAYILLDKLKMLNRAFWAFKAFDCLLAPSVAAERLHTHNLLFIYEQAGNTPGTPKMDPY